MAADAKGDSERRLEERIPAKIEVRFSGTEQVARAIKAYSLNFSVGGLCIKTKRKYDVGHELSLKMDIDAEHFELKATVAWVRGGNIGVRFLDVPDKDRDRLSSMVQALRDPV